MNIQYDRPRSHISAYSVFCNLVWLDKQQCELCQLTNHNRGNLHRRLIDTLAKAWFILKGQKKVGSGHLELNYGIIGARILG